MSEERIVKAEVVNDSDLVLTPIMDVKTAKARLAEFQEFVREYLVDGEDYGTIPGTAKPTLYQPGADKLCELYGLSDEYEFVAEYSVEDWNRPTPLFDYTMRCILRNKRTEKLIATGLGSANSYEGRYRWRDAARKCPQCGAEAISRGKEEFGGGWYCSTRKGGCGAKFEIDDDAIIGQKTGRIENDDLATYKNTVLKMASKRAKVKATLSATRSSGIFSQDLEDIDPDEVAGRPAHKKGGKAVDEMSPIITELEGVGVTRAQIAVKFRHDPAACSPAEIGFLKSAITTLKNDKTKKFSDFPWPPAEAKQTPAAQAQADPVKQSNGNGKPAAAPADKSPSLSDLFGPSPAESKEPEPTHLTIRGTPFVKMFADVIKAEGWTNLEEINGVLKKEWNILGIEDIPQDSNIYESITKYFKDHRPLKRK